MKNWLTTAVVVFGCLTSGAEAKGGSASPMFRTDRHWTLAGSQLAARQVAADELETSTVNFSGVDPGARLQRWSLGPTSAVTVRAPRAGPMEVRLAFANQIQNQEVEVRWNGRVLERIQQLPAYSRLERTYRVAAVAGANTLGFAYSDWNHNKTTFADEDARPLALYFSQLEFEFAGPPVQTADLIHGRPVGSVPSGNGIASVVLVRSEEVQAAVARIKERARTYGVTCPSLSPSSWPSLWGSSSPHSSWVRTTVPG